MATQVFVNLPTRNVDRSKEFFSALGWKIEPNFTDEKAACVVVDEHIHLMMLSYDFFATFTDKPIMDPAEALQVQTALSCDSRAAVDALLQKALAAGGAEPRPAQDMGFMYSRDFEDPDGNWFSIMWMDSTAAEKGPEAYSAEQEENFGHA